MKYIYWSITLLLAVLLINSCDQDDLLSREYPKINTLEVVDINEDGAVFRAEITSKGELPITEYGFVWSDEQPFIGLSNQIIFNGKTPSSNFSTNIYSTLAEGDSYNVRAYVKNDDFIVYGKIVEFRSKGSRGPEIKSFSPAQGAWTDTISIKGEHFSYMENQNSVKFGTSTAKVVYSNDTLIKALVPTNNDINDVKISLSIAGKIALSNANFKCFLPSVTELTNSVLTFGDTLVFKGSNLGTNKNIYSISLLGKNLPILDVNHDELKILVPSNLGKKDIPVELKVNSTMCLYKGTFRLKEPVITLLETKEVRQQNAEVIFHGENFNPLKAYNEVYIEGYKADILEISNSRIKVSLPNSVIPFYHVSESKNVSVAVETAEQKAYSPTNLRVNWESTWTRKNNFPGEGRGYGVGFAENGKGYIGTGTPNGSLKELSDFWKYDPNSDSWTRISDLPGKARTGAVAFTIDGKTYVGMGSENGTTSKLDRYRDMYLFNSDNDSWTQISDFPGISRSRAASFAVNGEAYVGTGYWGNADPEGGWNVANDFWKYNPNTDLWTETKEFPENTDMAVGFNIGDQAYVYNYSTLYKWENEEWIQIDAPTLGAWGNTAFSINGMAYFGLGCPHQSQGTSRFHEYNPETAESSQMNMDGRYPRYGASSFVIDGKAYVVGGFTYGSGVAYRRDVWEFDPSKPEI